METKIKSLIVEQKQVSEWRMFEAIVTLQDGTKRKFISSTLGDEKEAKEVAIKNNWSSPAIDVVVYFR